MLGVERKYLVGVYQVFGENGSFLVWMRVGVI